MIDKGVTGPPGISGSEIWVELYHPGEDYWCSTVFYEDGENEAKFLDHVRCDQSNNL